MKKEFLTIGVLLLFLSSILSAKADEVETENLTYVVPKTPSIVYVQSNKLFIQKRKPDGQLEAAKPFVIHGVSWSPSTKAPDLGINPPDGKLVPYGFFFDWVGREPQGHEILSFWQQAEFPAYYLKDLTLMQQMNVNTVRVYSDIHKKPAMTNQILDECYRRGIMVIMTIASAKVDFDSKTYQTVVNLYKNHPAILMWSIGNEWNMNYYFGYSNIDQAIAATNTAAQAVRVADSNHPVSSVLADQFSAVPVVCPKDNPCCHPSDGRNNVPAIVQRTSAIQLWGITLYRGTTFTNFFSQWKTATTKPFYVAEFGIDSFASVGKVVVNCNQAVKVSGQENQMLQSQINMGLWQHLKTQLSTLNPQGQALGGLVHEFNDELWKVGSYHVGLGGVVDYDGPDNIPDTADDDTSYDIYNREGFYLLGSQPDNILNEEYFGVVNANRVPKAVYWELKNFYGEL